MIANCGGAYLNPFAIESLDLDKDGDIVVSYVDGTDCTLLTSESVTLDGVGEAVCKELSRQMSNQAIMMHEFECMKLRFSRRYSE